MQKLIKITDDHYVVVDDSEIKERVDYITLPTVKGLYKKITHSTQPLNCNCSNRGYKLDTNCAERNHCFGKVQYLPVQEVKELTGEVDVEKDYVLSRLCVHNKRNPDYIPYDEDDELIKPTDCSCDNCFYGRTILSEKILQLNRALEDNKEKKYTEEDLKFMFEVGYRKNNLIESTFEDAVKFIQSLQPKTEWEVEMVDGKLKLK